MATSASPGGKYCLFLLRNFEKSGNIDQMLEAISWASEGYERTRCVAFAHGVCYDVIGCIEAD